MEAKFSCRSSVALSSYTYSSLISSLALFYFSFRRVHSNSRSFLLLFARQPLSLILLLHRKVLNAHNYITFFIIIPAISPCTFSLQSTHPPRPHRVLLSDAPCRFFFFKNRARAEFPITITSIPFGNSSFWSYVHLQLLR